MNKISIAAILLSLLGFAFYQKSDDNKIYWSKDYQLTWDDYLGKPQANSKYGAISSLGISAPFEYKGENLETDVRSYFNKKVSWVNVQEKTENLLKHEQGHFDITDIYARKLRKLLSCHKFKKKTLKADFMKLYQGTNRELDAEQNLYDKETNLSHNKAKQNEWNEKIAKQLEELEPYSETHLSIKVK